MSANYGNHLCGDPRSGKSKIARYVGNGIDEPDELRET